MNFLGVSPVEIIFIAILGLIIFGPERLPEIGRFAGKTVARVLAWQYTSPEAQMLTELRRDIEKQIIDIRDEMVYARQQLDVRSELSDLQRETEALLKGAITPPKPVGVADATVAAQATAEVAPSADATVAAQATAGDAPSIEPPVELEPASSMSLPEGTNGFISDLLPPATPNLATEEPLPSRSEIAALTQQIQTLSTNLQALQDQLRQRGLLEPTWQPTPDDVQQEQIV